jgi:hypothetical protein
MLSKIADSFGLECDPASAHEVSVEEPISEYMKFFGSRPSRR